MNVTEAIVEHFRRHDVSEAECDVQSASDIFDMLGELMFMNYFDPFPLPKLYKVVAKKIYCCILGNILSDVYSIFKNKLHERNLLVIMVGHGGLPKLQTLALLM